MTAQSPRLPAHVRRIDITTGAATVFVTLASTPQTGIASVAALWALGCTVIAPNVRESSGFGRRWMSLDDRTQRGDVLGDMICLHEALMAEHGIDPARIGITGQSYGCYMTALALGRTPKRWAAAAPDGRIR